MKLTDHLASVRQAVAAQIPDALMVGGAAAVSYGVGLVYAPGGWIVSGVFLLVAGWMLAKGGD